MGKDPASINIKIIEIRPNILVYISILFICVIEIVILLLVSRFNCKSCMILPELFNHLILVIILSVLIFIICFIIFIIFSWSLSRNFLSFRAILFKYCASSKDIQCCSKIYFLRSFMILRCLSFVLSIRTLHIILSF